jgi:hypothetical protein
LQKAGYKIFQKKAHICQDTVKYLRFHLSQGQHRLGPERKPVLRGNRPSAPFQPPRPVNRLENF